MACTCAVQRKTTVRADDVFPRMSLASQHRHGIAYIYDLGFVLEKQYWTVFAAGLFGGGAHYNNSQCVEYPNMQKTDIGYFYLCTY